MSGKTLKSSVIVGSAQQLKDALLKAGYKTDEIQDAFPDWWAPEAERSVSARVDLRFTVARKLGLDAKKIVRDVIVRVK